MKEKLIDTKIFYNGNRLLSYSDALFYFSVGNRGCGKTYFYKKYCIQNFLKDGSRWIYVRRYKSELKMMATFFADVQKEFPKVKLEMRGKDMYCNGKLMGHVISLSTNKTAKGLVFDNVKMIVFDEFMADTSGFYRYMADEVEMYLELFESVARIHDDVRGVFLSNAISIVNPYFMYFDLEPNGEERFTKKKINGIPIVLEMYTNEDFKNAKRETKFGRLISGTNYGNYLIDNTMKNDDSMFISARQPDSKNVFNMMISNYYIGVWYSPTTRLMYCSTDHNKTVATFVVYPEDYNGTNTLVKNLKDYSLTTNLDKFFKTDSLRFENQNIKSSMYTLFKKLRVF